MKILFAAPENAWAGFLGKIRAAMPEHEFVATGKFDVDSLKGYDVLIPTMTRIAAEILKTGDRLKLVQQCGAGLEGVDIETANSLGIEVANVPTDISQNADSVAELGIYMMVGLSRRFNEFEKSFQDGKMGEPHGRAVTGRTVGLVGLGGIGRALARRLKAFDAEVIGIKRSDPEAAKKELGLDWAGGPDDLFSLLNRSDYVVLCLPLTEQSRGLIDEKAVSEMKEDAFLINLSRGGIIDYDALTDALKNGKIAGAGLDVYWDEPPDPDDPIFQYNVLATPHIAGSTDVSMSGIVKGVAENIRRIERGEKPLYTRGGGK
jgi:phosphoglycerate dehydrogenase-like enzyme